MSIKAPMTRAKTINPNFSHRSTKLVGDYISGQKWFVNRA
ncbi:hypothetical protein D082_26700 [Synechocystis sp. PCC 6714]|nr:hypothetical protein D082_26700 [Synechocystis sp. PCC 6714]